MRARRARSRARSAGGAGERDEPVENRSCRSAARLANRGYHQALNLHAEAAQGQWSLALGQLALAGRVVTARRWLREAAALIEARSPTLGRYGVGYAFTFAAEAAALGGDLDEADSALSRADDLLPDGAALCNAERGRVWTAAARGELTTARRLALDSAAALARVGLGLGAQAGEARLCEVMTEAGFTRFRRAAETPVNIVLEARP